jgi:hypothetical protein
MIAQNLLVAEERINAEVVETAWDAFFDDWASDNSHEPCVRMDDAKFHPHPTRDELTDLE